MQNAKADDQEVANVYKKAGAEVVDLTSATVAKWQAIAKETAWKDFAGRSDTCAKLDAAISGGQGIEQLFEANLDATADTVELSRDAITAELARIPWPTAPADAPRPVSHRARRRFTRAAKKHTASGCPCGCCWGPGCC